jgi:hypothetical protein
MEEKQINETVLELVKSFQETNQAMAASIVAAQERNMKRVQVVYQSALEALEGQAEGTHTLMEELRQHARRQQEIFQKMSSQEVFQKAVKVSMDTYMNFLRAPLTYYQQALEATEAATRQGLEYFQRASESFQKSAQQEGETPQQEGETPQQEGETPQQQ